MLPESSLFAVFLLGLSGGIHCAGMCGGIVSLFGLRPQQRVIPIAVEGHRAGNALSLAMPLSYNAGRLSTYTALGVIGGSIGSLSLLSERWVPAQTSAFVIGNCVLIISGLYVLGVRRVANTLEALGRPLWKRVQLSAARSLQGTGALAALAAGGLWGLVPCGLVYSVLVLSITSGSAIQGGALMLAFGLGTLPNLLLMSWSAERLVALRGQRLFRWIAGGLILSYGLFGLLRVFVAPHVPGLESICYTPPT